jgi:hypothetical protein
MRLPPEVHRHPDSTTFAIFAIFAMIANFANFDTFVSIRAMAQRTTALRGSPHQDMGYFLDTGDTPSAV